MSYRNDSCDDDGIRMSRTRNECATPAHSHTSKSCDNTLALTPWNPSEVWPVKGGACAALTDAEQVEGAGAQMTKLVRRLQALGCEQRLIDACHGQRDLEALFDIVSGRFDSRNSPSRSAALLGAPGGLGGTQETMHKRVGLARVFPAEAGESMAHIHIYSTRHVPASQSGDSSPSAGAADILCRVECGKHEAKTSIAPGGRETVFNERFDFGIDIRNPHAQVRASNGCEFARVRRSRVQRGSPPRVLTNASRVRH